MIDIISSSVVGVNVSSVTADGFKRDLIGGHVISLVDRESSDRISRIF